MADDRNADLSQKAPLTVGSHIKCRYQGGEVEGQVAAFNGASRLLIIKAPASNGKSTNNDIYVINADYVEKLSIEDGSPADSLRQIDFAKLEKRRLKSIGLKKARIRALSADVAPELEKRRLKSIGLKKARIRALSADVAPEGRKLFLTIIKTIDEVAWDGEKILVLNEVTISPPYRVENVRGEKEASVIHVKKIVDKHWKEQQSSQPPT